MENFVISDSAKTEKEYKFYLEKCNTRLSQPAAASPSSLEGQLKGSLRLEGENQGNLISQRNLIQFYSRKAFFKDFGAVGHELNL